MKVKKSSKPSNTAAPSFDTFQSLGFSLSWISA